MTCINYRYVSLEIHSEVSVKTACGVKAFEKTDVTRFFFKKKNGNKIQQNKYIQIFCLQLVRINKRMQIIW